MGENKTHWKKLTNSNYIGAHDLAPGQELKLTITEIKMEKVTNSEGKTEEMATARYKGVNKPMILNKTNMKIIAELYGPYIEDWVGKVVTIHAVKVRAFGEVTEALRVKKVRNV